jgi:hypothetical protein
MLVTTRYAGHHASICKIKLPVAVWLWYETDDIFIFQDFDYGNKHALFKFRRIDRFRGYPHR